MLISIAHYHGDLEDEASAPTIELVADADDGKEPVKLARRAVILRQLHELLARTI